MGRRQERRPMTLFSQCNQFLRLSRQAGESLTPSDPEEEKEIGKQCTRRRHPVPMQWCVMPDQCCGAQSGCHAPWSDPRCRGASQRTLRQIVQSWGEPSQARSTPPCAQAMSGHRCPPGARCASGRRGARPGDAALVWATRRSNSALILHDVPDAVKSITGHVARFLIFRPQV